MQHAVQLGVSAFLWKYCTSPGKCTEIAKRQVALLFCVLKIIFERYSFLNVKIKCDLLYQVGGWGNTVLLWRVKVQMCEAVALTFTFYLPPLLFTFQLNLFNAKMKTNFLGLTGSQWLECCRLKL